MEVNGLFIVYLLFEQCDMTTNSIPRAFKKRAHSLGDITNL